MLALKLSEILYTGKRQSIHIDWFGVQVTNYRSRVPLGQEANIFYFSVSFVEYYRWNVGLEAQWNFIYG